MSLRPLKMVTPVKEADSPNNGLVVLNPHKKTGHTAKTFFPVSKKEIGWAFLN